MSNSDDHPQSDPLLGTTFARRYLIERRLGRGGMGVVYQATQVDLNRQVVLKVLAPDWMGDPEALARFEREARGLNGYYDMATPYFASRYTFNHLIIHPDLAKNIVQDDYTAGHMMYLNLPDLKKQKEDLAKFIREASAKP